MDWLKERNIVFTHHDVSVDKDALREMVQKSAQLGVPVIEVDDELVVGFDRERLDKLLA